MELYKTLLKKYDKVRKEEFRLSDCSNRIIEYYIVEKDGKCGVLDNKGEVLYNLEYDDIEIRQMIIFPDGFLGVFDFIAKKNGKYALLNGKNFDFEYDEITPHEYDFIVKKDGKYGVVTCENKVLIEINKESIEEVEKTIEDERNKRLAPDTDGEPYEDPFEYLSRIAKEKCDCKVYKVDFTKKSK